MCINVRGELITIVKGNTFINIQLLENIIRFVVQDKLDIAYKDIGYVIKEKKQNDI